MADSGEAEPDSACISEGRDKKAAVLAAFSSCDPEASGTISTANLLTFLTTVGIAHPAVILDGFAASGVVGCGADGQVNYGAFVQFLWESAPIAHKLSVSRSVTPDPSSQRLAPDPPPSAPSVPETVLDDKAVSKVHSVVRWGKTTQEVQDVVDTSGASLAQMANARDARNGNQVLHIAAQNGHGHLVDYFLGAGANANGQNNGGQTPLHMSVEYDFYGVSESLMKFAADPAILNSDGHAAIVGISGSKTGSSAWNNPVNILKSASDDKADLDFALAALEKADPSTIDKVELARVGMAKRKTLIQNWDKARFLDIMKKM